MTIKNLMLIVFVTTIIASCRSAPEDSGDITADAMDVKQQISNRYAQVDQMFETSAGYAIFPNVGSGAYIIGGSSGDGVVYEDGNVIGYADMKEIDVGLQAGGKSFSEVIFFETDEKLEDFKGDNLKLTANASVVALEEGVSRAVDFRNGVAIVTMPQEGAMAGVSVGGQSFEYFPAD